MKESVLLLETGSQALAELTSDELNLILAKFTDDQVRQAAMNVFNLLRKKFKATYRMGTLYREETSKYKFYDQMYKEYARSLKAGRLGVDPGIQTNHDLDRYKWPKETK
jgi:pantothenate kinase